MQSHCAALALVGHLHLDAKHIAELPLEGGAIGIRGFGRVARARTGTARVRSGSFPPRTLFDLANREAFGDHFLGQRDGVGRGRDRPSMAHIDIALQ